MDSKTNWFVYILECKDGSYYTGITNDIEKRMKVHSCGKGSKYVKRKGFSHLIAKSFCKNRSEATRSEYYIKTLSRKEKIKWFSTNS